MGQPPQRLSSSAAPSKLKIPSFQAIACCVLCLHDADAVIPVTTACWPGDNTALPPALSAHGAFEQGCLHGGLNELQEERAAEAGSEHFDAVAPPQGDHERLLANPASDLACARASRRFHQPLLPGKFLDMDGEAAFEDTPFSSGVGREMLSEI